MENNLRDRAERMARKLRACAVDEQCAACAEECGVNDGTLLLAAAQTIRDLLEGAGGEERTEGETETPSWIKAAYEAGPENYDTVLDRGAERDRARGHGHREPAQEGSAAGDRGAAADDRAAGAAHDRRGAGDAPVDSAQRRGGGSDGRTEIKKGPGGAATPSGQSDEGQMTTKYTPMITDGGEKGKEKFYDGSADGGNRGH